MDLRTLTEAFGPSGQENEVRKLILDAAFGLPDETPVANVRAMFDAARKYAG